MKEAGVLIDKSGDPIYWHAPPSRDAASLPDSPLLWDIIWKNRNLLAGFAHSHPGGGWPGPSQTDLTTFAAIESGLGKKLDWWITSADHVVLILMKDDENFVSQKLVIDPPWIRKLRQISGIYV